MSIVEHYQTLWATGIGRVLVATAVGAAVALLAIWLSLRDRRERCSTCGIDRARRHIGVRAAGETRCLWCCYDN